MLVKFKGYLFENRDCWENKTLQDNIFTVWSCIQMLDMKRIASQILKIKCSKLHMESMIFLRVHCIKVGILLPPLMLRIVHPTFTNILYIVNHIRVDHQYHCEAMRRNVALFQQNLRKSNGCKFEVFDSWQLVDIFPFYSWTMDIWTLHTYWLYICGRIWVSKIGVHVLILEAMTIHWPNHQWLSQWASRPSMRHVWFQGVAHATKDDRFLQWPPPTSKKLCLLVQIYWPFTSFKTSFSFESNKIE
jgi:hypothetical protein